MTAYTFPFKASVAAGLGLALSLLAGASQAAENSGNPLGNMLVRDSKFELNIRSYAMQRTRPMQPDSEAWALGGWLGYRSGWLGEVFSVGLTGCGRRQMVPAPCCSGRTSRATQCWVRPGRRSGYKARP